MQILITMYLYFNLPGSFQSTDLTRNIATWSVWRKNIGYIGFKKSLWKNLCKRFWKPAFETFSSIFITTFKKYFPSRFRIWICYIFVVVLTLNFRNFSLDGRKDSENSNINAIKSNIWKYGLIFTANPLVFLGRWEGINHRKNDRA